VLYCNAVVPLYSCVVVLLYCCTHVPHMGHQWWHKLTAIWFLLPNLFIEICKIPKNYQGFQSKDSIFIEHWFLGLYSHGFRSPWYFTYVPMLHRNRKYMLCGYNFRRKIVFSYEALPHPLNHVASHPQRP
jgi:hypothetical protein